ncbi:MAG: UDP-N-acetylmuramoyl-tripeptide--D-alanyl-D-alanine ligase [Candidatus Dasytiphilus stammeri]
MIPISLKKLAKIIDGELIGSDIEIFKVITDTRQNSEQALFIALIGKNFDAHDFVEEAIKNNKIIAVIVSRILVINVPQIVVKNTSIALGKIAKWLRKQLTSKVIALTGSAGKTTVKEMLTAILKQCGNTLSTIGNMNNHIGVPLTLLQLNKEYLYTVIELGANHPGEIYYTVQLTNPDVVLINNITLSHLHGFGSILGVAKSKGEIFTGLVENGIAVINAESNYWPYWRHLLGNQLVWRFSITPQPESNFFATNIIINVTSTQFTLNTPKGCIEVYLPLLGKHNIANALAAASLASAVDDISLQKIKMGLAKLKALPGRSYPIVLDRNKLLIDDSYNANVGSMKAAALTLSQMPGYRIMVVGDIAELGDHSVIYHQMVGFIVRLADIDKVISIGIMSKNISDLNYDGEHFYDQSKLIKRLQILMEKYQNVTILIKGSRLANMENIVHSLQEKYSC